ncbi:hypothetical protein C4568_02415 [Candidatus Parcubacteria bacterium]|nr:MAG: hypothetical protein C4568_02415 [Candidatus Parcubacteria bacterium]
MLEASLWGLRYVRMITETPGVSSMERLKRRYAFIHIVSFTPSSLPGFSETVKKTPLIRLDRPIEDIFAAFNDTTRNEIRRTEKMPELSFVHGERHRGDAYSLYRAFEHAQGRTPKPKNEITRSLLFTAYWKEELIATAICFEDGGWVRLSHLASRRLTNTKEYSHAIIAYASRRLMYEICRWGKQHEKHSFDLGIINLSDPSKKGIAQFKQSFGGLIVDTYIYRWKSPLFRFVTRLWYLD